MLHNKYHVTDKYNHNNTYMYMYIHHMDNKYDHLIIHTCTYMYMYIQYIIINMIMFAKIQLHVYTSTST